jgi:hypothetical protein
MTTPLQIAANRANAQRSTGPKTEPGKARSRVNAWKHGLTANKIIIAGEKAQQFESFRAQLWEDFQPGTGIESVLVDRLAGVAWRLLRAPRFEVEAIKANYRVLESLERVTRYEAALLKAFRVTLQQLLDIQDRRRQTEERIRTIEDVPAIEVLSSPVDDRNAA